MSRRLTADQEHLLAEVQIAHAARQNARSAAEQEARRMIAERMHTAEVAESRAVRRAMDAGVSRRRVGIEGLGTSDYHTVTKVLAVTEPEILAAEAARDDRVRTISRAERAGLDPAEGVEVPEDAIVLRVDWEGFESFTGGIVDLHGYVFQGPRGRWLLVSDDLDEAGSPGSGPLAAEARRNERLIGRLISTANEVQAA